MSHGCRRCSTTTSTCWDAIRSRCRRPRSGENDDHCTILLMTRPTRASDQDNDATDFPVPLLPKPDDPKWGNACPIALSHKGVGGFTTQSDGIWMFLHVAWVLSLKGLFSEKSSTRLSNANALPEAAARHERRLEGVRLVQPHKGSETVIACWSAGVWTVSCRRRSGLASKGSSL